jgi:catechol 2,3-dioxygenase-like lactoylglutathione lyase family enzyme
VHGAAGFVADAKENIVPIRLDHLIVPSRDRKAAAALFASILDLPWSEDTAAGPFSPVYVNDELTLDFGQILGEASPQHYCFQVSEADFDAILGRLKDKGIPYRSTPMGPADMQVRQGNGGRSVYWGEPDGHAWEILTSSYARAPR